MRLFLLSEQERLEVVAECKRRNKRKDLVQRKQKKKEGRFDPMHIHKICHKRSVKQKSKVEEPKLTTKDEWTAPSVSAIDDEPKQSVREEKKEEGGDANVFLASNHDSTPHVGR